LLTFFRSILFGGDPDRLMLNYRLSQYMSILHTTDLVDHVLALDPRVTYWPSKRKDLFEDVFGIQVSPVDLTVTGSVLPNEAQGRLLHQWLVSNLGGGSYQVTRETPLYGEALFLPTFTGGLSSPMALAGSSLFCVVPQTSVGPWNIQVATRPISTCADVLKTLAATASGDQLDQLFGIDDVEPFFTYRKLWEENGSVSYRLGSILMAVTQRINLLYPNPVLDPLLFAPKPPKPEPIPTLSLNPASGAAGSSFTGTVSGFEPTETVTLVFSGTPVGNGVTDSTGAANIVGTVPAATSTGSYTVTAIGQISSFSASASFTVIIPSVVKIWDQDTDNWEAAAYNWESS
jgi:hypothetical protein